MAARGSNGESCRSGKAGAPSRLVSYRVKTFVRVNLVAYFTLPFLLLLAIWLLLSLRRGEVNFYARWGTDWFDEADTGQWSRHHAPAQFWIAFGALAGLWLVCAVVTVLAIWLGVAW